jgi:hypothetical protein
MNEGDMEDRDSGFEAAWEKARGRLFRPAAPPTRADTEAFTQRVLARLPEEAGALWPGRWLAPSLAFSAAALALALMLPPAEDDGSESLIASASPAVAAWAASPASAEDLVGWSAEDR